MRFRKKPIVIEAEQFLPNDCGNYLEQKEHCKSLGIEIKGYMTPQQMEEAGKDMCLIQYIIETLEGPAHCTHGDWIITGIEGEKYPCNLRIFEKTYEQVDPD